MEDFYSFLRPRTPEPSLDDYLSVFSDQYGQGVVTRRQARLAEGAAQPQVDISDVHNSPGVPPPPNVELPPNVQAPPDVELPPNVQPLPQVQPAPEVQPAAEIQSQSQTEIRESDDNSAPYLKDTLVASNGEVEAYCIKSFFRKMQNFS